MLIFFRVEISVRKFSTLRSLISWAWTVNQTIIDQNSSRKKLVRMSQPVRVASSAKKNICIPFLMPLAVCSACHSHYNAGTKTLNTVHKSARCSIFSAPKNFELWYSFTLARAPFHRQSFCLFSCVYIINGMMVEHWASTKHFSYWLFLFLFLGYDRTITSI